MRDPVERFVSRYNFNREAGNPVKVRYMSRQAGERSHNITSCVLTRHPECTYQGLLGRQHRLYRLDSQVQ